MCNNCVDMESNIRRFLIIAFTAFFIAIQKSNETETLSPSPAIPALLGLGLGQSNNHTTRGFLQGLLSPVVNLGGTIEKVLGLGNQNLCEKLGEGNFPKNDDCTKYLECSKAEIHGTYKSCSGNDKFDALLNECSPQGRCQEELCKGLNGNGKLYEDPNDKTKYFRCTKSQITVFACKGGLYYSDRAHACMQSVPLEDISAEDPEEASRANALIDDDMLKRLQKLKQQ